MQIQDEPLDAGAEANAGSVPPADLLGEAVVPSPTTDRGLPAHLARPDLEDRPGVVVEPSHQAVIQDNRNVLGVQRRFHEGKMLSTRLTQAVDERGRALRDRLAGGNLAVQQPKWVRREAAPTVAAQLVHVARVVRAQPIDIGWSTHWIADRIELQREISQAERSVAERLTVKLVGLAETACLRTIVAKHADETAEPHRLGERVHPVLQICPHDGGGSLRAQGEVVASLVQKGIHLLLDYVCHFTGTPPKKARVFEGWRANLLVTIESREAASPPLDVAPVWDVGRQDVLGSTRGLKHTSPLAIQHGSNIIRRMTGSWPPIVGVKGKRPWRA